MRLNRLTVAVLLPAVALALAACGSSSSKSTLSVSIAESGNSAKFTLPTTTKGGLVQVTLANKGKGPHSLQFVRVEGNHTTAEAYKIVNSNSNKTPSWLRAEGGVSQTAPGQSNSGTVNLPAGKYLVTELGSPGSNAQPAQADLTVTSGKSGTLPSAPATVTAAAPAKDKYKWEISGLHAGHNVLKFNSQGSNAIHFIGAVRIKPGQHPSLAEIQKSFQSNGPPSFADITSIQSTAVLDGGKSQVTTLDLKPGTYVFFCPLTDRDGGKPHLAEGLLTKYTVK